MKVLHITKDDFSGAGLCCLRIHKSLKDLGVDSKVLVERRKFHEDGVFQYGHLCCLLYRGINKIVRMLHLPLNDYNKLIVLSRRTHKAYTLPTSIIDLSKHELVKEADVIHLHWINGYVDYPSFFKKVKKPILWTLHDENLFYGVAHYSDAVCVNDPIEIKYFKIKERSIKSIDNLTIVFLSEYFRKTFSKNALIANAEKCVVNNSVDSKKYHPKEKEYVRKKYNIPSNAIVLLFVAYDITTKRKGLDILIRAINTISDDRILILAVGNTRGFTNPSVITTGPVDDSETMSEYISAADYFVMPSLQEAFAQTPLEAMACGIPAVVFPVSGSEELISETNGIRCNGFSVEDLVEGLQSAFKKKYCADEIRKDVEERFSPQKIATQYVSLYQHMLLQ